MSASDKRQAAERRRSSLLDMDVLPQRYRRRRLTWGAVAPWIALAGMMALVFPTFQWFSSTNDNYNQVARNLTRQQATLASVKNPSGTEAALQTQVAHVMNQAQAYHSLTQDIDLQQVAWGPTIRGVLAKTPPGLEVDDIAQSGTVLTLNGRAFAYQQPLDYARALETSGQFDSVQVKIIQRVEPTPASLGPTPTPGSSELYGFEITLALPASNLATPTPEATHAP